MNSVNDEVSSLSGYKNCIDFFESKREKRVIPQQGICEELDELKMTYDGLNDFLVCTSAQMGLTFTLSTRTSLGNKSLKTTSDLLM